MTKVDIKYFDERCKLSRGTNGSIGFDARARIDEPVTIKAGEIAKIPLGFALDMKDCDLGCFVFSRSGISTNHGVMCINSVGVVDSDYRGEVHACLWNTGAKGDFTIEPYDRIVQCIFINAEKVLLSNKDELDESDRGTNGFNSTGVK